MTNAPGCSKRRTTNGKEIMIVRQLQIALVGAAAVLVLILANGCASNKQTEDLLSSAGFKMLSATNAAQEAHLQTLPPHKISEVQRNGKMYFVYPDAGRNVLYVGQSEQYQKYQKLLEERNLEEQQMNEREIDEDTGWNAWGPTIPFP